jgi:hypothetical protein
MSAWRELLDTVIVRARIITAVISYFQRQASLQRKSLYSMTMSSVERPREEDLHVVAVVIKGQIWAIISDRGSSVVRLYHDTFGFVAGFPVIAAWRQGTLLGLDRLRHPPTTANIVSMRGQYLFTKKIIFPTDHLERQTKNTLRKI